MLFSQYFLHLALGKNYSGCPGHDVYFSAIKTWKEQAAHRFWNANFLLQKVGQIRWLVGSLVAINNFRSKTTNMDGAKNHGKTMAIS
jgi:hypothetical protein